MSRVIKFFTVIRNNWKKTVFGIAAVSYGVSYGNEKYENDKLMTYYCLKAQEFGDAPVPSENGLKRIVVILNPAANRRKSKKLFEKYCEPLLHLSGILVDIVQTEKEGHATKVMETIDPNTDAVLVAGGDGTLSEVVTGLLRKGDRTEAVYPVGVIPLGRTNTVANSLFGAHSENLVKMIAEATMAVIKGEKKQVDVMKIQVMEDDPEKPVKPVYALCGVQWGVYRDAHNRRDKYWYWGNLRSYVSYIFTGLKGEKSGICWHCDAELDYVLPCSGCSNCFVEKVENGAAGRRWWHSFLSPSRNSKGPSNKPNYSAVTNQDCGNIYPMKISTVDLSLTTANVCPNCSQEGAPHMKLTIGPETVSYFELVSEGWRRESGKGESVSSVLQVREIAIRPLIESNKSGDKDFMLSIDNEEYEVKPVHVKLLSKALPVFSAT